MNRGGSSRVGEKKNACRNGVSRVNFSKYIFKTARIYSRAPVLLYLISQEVLLEQKIFPRLTKETKLVAGFITKFVLLKQTNSRLQVPYDIIIHNFMLCIWQDGNSTFQSTSRSAFALFDDFMSNLGNNNSLYFLICFFSFFLFQRPIQQNYRHFNFLIFLFSNWVLNINTS